MELRFTPNRIVEIDDARICYRHFSGDADRYHKTGDRDFSLIIPNQEIADALIDAGFYVKIKAPKEDGDQAFMYLKIIVNFNERGPKIYLTSGKNRNLLDETTVRRLDRIDIRSVNLDIQRGKEPWENNGTTGYATYLRSMEVIQEVDRFAARYAEEESPEE